MTSKQQTSRQPLMDQRDNRDQRENRDQRDSRAYDRILVTYAELALKGRNRADFRRRLVDNLVWRLRAEGLDWKVGFRHDRIYVEVPRDSAQESLDVALAMVTATPGVATVSRARFFPRSNEPWPAHPDMGGVEEEVLGLARQHFGPGQSFRVKVKRADKRFPGRSSDLERELGALILRETGWEKVKLKDPDRNFQVSIYPEGIYVTAERRRAVGGLPVGSGGRVLTLLSGGLDSPVAAWMMARRGCSMDFVHFTATHLQLNEAEDNKVAQLARILSQTTLRSRIYLLPYTHFDLALLGNPTPYSLALFRRFIARCAERLAETTGARALVNGDSLGQVASQTLDNMVSNSRAIDMPLLRPLVGMDKNEIVDMARRIGTFDLSVAPYKDCCALIDREPRTRSRHEHLSRIEQEALGDYDGLIDATLADAVCLEFECGQRVDADRPDPLRRKAAAR